MAKLDDDEIAVLRRERDAALAREAALAGELASRTQELAERNAASEVQVAHQAAIIDVLKVISSTSSDAQPVFEIIGRRAIELCGASAGGIYQFDGTLVHLSWAGGFDPDRFAAFAAEYPKPPDLRMLAHRAIVEGRMFYSPDVMAEPGMPRSSINLGHRASLNVPLMRGGVAIGTITVTHRDVDGFSDAHKELLRTFAEQAVIAIGSVATFRQLQARTGELAIQVAHQSATIDVLKVMSATTSDTMPPAPVVTSNASCPAPFSVSYSPLPTPTVWIRSMASTTAAG